jgi:dienelactone hydrolase
MTARRWMGGLLASLFLSTALTAQPLKQGRKQDIEITTGDGIILKGTYYTPLKPGPGVLLLHQCNMDRKSWDGLATDLTNAGLHVLTVDYRGFGESGGERITDPQQRRVAMTERWPLDVEAALAILLGQSGIDKSRIAVGGASCGVTQAVTLASRRREIKALVLLSGNAGDTGNAYLAATQGVAVFGAASQEDTTAAEAIKGSLAASRNPANTLKMYSGAGHGVPMFAKEPDLQPAIVSWLVARLGAS